jgi:uncharacterized protein
MGYYALLYQAGNNFVERRTPYREEHLQMARDAYARGELVMAGALGDPIDRALLVFRGESPEVAQTFAQHDPYVLSGLVQHWEVCPWKVVVGGDEAPAAGAAGGR